VLFSAAQCPRCRSEDLRRSRSRSPLDKLLRVFLRVSPYRCRYCSLRFFRSPRTVDRDRDALTS